MNFDMIKQARELQSKMKKTQKELGKTLIEVESGKGAVKITIDGQQNIKSIKISPEIIDPNKPEILEKTLLKAIQDATNESQKVAEKKMSELTGGLKIPGLM
ncbi:MAG: YbaB/EbfC family nucleoid-associated protein [Dehalococcoidales bacterium]|nr:YbaB/EbfC family nucleoid-associated protein [Dehalococcoidales bacterium]